jgi:hypothetical protein
VFGTGLDLIGLWVTILWWTTLDHITDKNLGAAKASQAEQLLKELPRRSDKWPPLAIFMVAWSLSDEHHTSIRRSFTRDSTCAPTMEPAEGAGVGRLGNKLKRIGRGQAITR